MKPIKQFIDSLLMLPEKKVYEMTTIGKPVLNKEKRIVAIHGVNSGDRPYPHIHIYLASDKFPYNEFNFEISLIDILCKAEINLVRMRDKKTRKLINNRDKCSWEGYNKLRDDFEDWLFGVSSFPGDFIDNLDAIIWNYNNESEYVKEQNALLAYIRSQGMKILENYKKYFNSSDKENYKECF